MPAIHELALGADYQLNIGKLKRLLCENHSSPGKHLPGVPDDMHGRLLKKIQDQSIGGKWEKYSYYEG